jgi:multiple sugar transport system substrate-binding protein
MGNLTRRALVRTGAALGAAGALNGPALLDWAKAWAQSAPWKPERGAQLSLLRDPAFVQAEYQAFVAATEAFTQATGVKVTVSRESIDDIQPKASVAANTGTGPDLFLGNYSLPHLFAGKCLDVTDLAEYPGMKYGGWVPSAVAYGKGTGSKWIDFPIYYAGQLMNYRISSLKKAAFAKFPATTGEFLEYARAMKANNTPGGLALGHATNDATVWVYWCLWAHGGNLVDKNDKVIINSPETEKALVFAKQLHETMVPGVLSWNDASNNKAFLAGEIHWTLNTYSIYIAAKTDASKKDIADDMDHAFMPIGPIGTPTELHNAIVFLAMAYTKYPQACKAHRSDWRSRMSPSLGQFRRRRPADIIAARRVNSRARRSRRTTWQKNSKSE